MLGPRSMTGEAMETERAAIRQITIRILPLIWIIVFFAALDRSNLSFAALQMNKDVGLGAEAFGFGAGLFFIPYALFAVPSNLLLQRFRPRVWIPVLMVSWGVVSSAMALIEGRTSFFVLRFLLGVAESGVNPAAFYLLSLWYPSHRRAAAMGQMHWAQLFSILIGAPLSGALLSVHAFGLAGWQMMFLAEGLPVILLAFAIYVLVEDDPTKATWLRPEQKQWLLDELTADEARRTEQGAPGTFMAAFKSPIVWLLIVFYAFQSMSYYGQSLWLPQILKEISGLSDFEVSLATTIPYLLGGAATFLVGRLSDVSGHRRLVISLCMLGTAAGSAISGLGPTPLIQYLGFCISTAAMWGVLGVFWAVASDALKGAAVAGGLALITGTANLLSFPAPYFIGWMRAHTNGFSGALVVMAILQLVASLLPILLPSKTDRRLKTAG
jgi:ACS family tartrate transporter-like MFS transporter